MFRIKPVLVLLFLPLLYLFLFTKPPLTCAQSAQSSCVITKVGNPKVSPTIPASCAGSGGANCIQPPNYPADLEQAILDKFGVHFVGFDAEHLKWYWEELWNTSGTNFSKLIKGAVVDAAFCPNEGNFSCQKGCGGPVSIYFGTYAGEEFNKVLIVHELGHYINYCNNETGASYVSDFDKAFADEGGITYYAQNAGPCSGSDNQSEDYAEMITYYLHPKSLSQSINCGPNNGAPNPFYDANGQRNGKFPEHFAVAQKILGTFACSATAPSGATPTPTP